MLTFKEGKMIFQISIAFLQDGVGLSSSLNSKKWEGKLLFHHFIPDLIYAISLCEPFCNLYKCLHKDNSEDKISNIFSLVNLWSTYFQSEWNKSIHNLDHR